MNENEAQGSAQTTKGGLKETAGVVTGSPRLKDEGPPSWFLERPAGDPPVDSRYSEPVARGQSEAERRFPCY